MPVTDRYSTLAYCTSHNYGHIHSFIAPLCVAYLYIILSGIPFNDHICFICQRCKVSQQDNCERTDIQLYIFFCFSSCRVADQLHLGYQLSSISSNVSCCNSVTTASAALTSTSLICSNSSLSFLLHKFSCFYHYLFIYLHLLKLVLVHVFMYSLTHAIMENISCVSPRKGMLG